MIISLSVVLGFQEAIREKIIGFGGHFHVNEISQGHSNGTPRLKRDDKLLSSLRAIPEVKHVQLYAASAGIIESRGTMQGVLVKGIDDDFDTTFISTHMQDGQLISRFDNDSAQILLSSYLSARLAVKVGDKISVYIFQQDDKPRQRNFTICGIYSTGLEQMDQQLVYIALPQMVRMAGWGLRTEIFIDSIAPQQYSVEGRTFGGEGNRKFQWSEEAWNGTGPHYFAPHSDTIITLIATDESASYPDTTWAHFTRNGNAFNITTTSTQGEMGYTGGYEILIHAFDDLWLADDKIFELTTSSFLQTQRITDRIPELFSWLEMLDINVVIIVILMIVISIVNMTSAILIIILERQQFVGILKTLGMSNPSLRNVFIRHSSRIILRGMVIGNLIGLIFVLFQHYTSFIPMDPGQYYLDAVPVKISWWYLLLLNSLTACVCVLSMVLPAMYVTRLRPVDALRFH